MAETPVFRPMDIIAEYLRDLRTRAAGKAFEETVDKVEEDEKDLDLKKLEEELGEGP